MHEDDAGISLRCLIWATGLSLLIWGTVIWLVMEAL